MIWARMLAYITGTRLVKKFEGLEKARLAGSTSLFGLLGSQDEFLDPTGSAPSFDSSGAMIHDRVRQEMRAVLSNSDSVPFLGDSAAALLAEARQYYGTASLNFDRVVQDGSTVILLTWRGDWANDALALLLSSIGLTSWNKGIVVRVKSTSTSDLREALVRIATMEIPDPAELRLNLATLLQEKWSMDFEGARRSAAELANAAASS